MSLIFPDGSYTTNLYQKAAPNLKQVRPGFSPFSARPQAQGGASGQPDAGSRQWSGGTPSFNERATQPTSGKPLDMSRYRPGQAQPVQQPSRGTPYASQSIQAPFANAAGNQQQPSRQQITGDPSGAFAGMAPEFRPPAFQIDVAKTPWGPSMDPFADRDAMIRAINEQRVQRQIAFNTGGTSPMNPGAMPWLDYGSAIQQAGLGQGSPSMSPEYGDSLIGRLNQQFGQPAPTAYYPGFNPQSQNQYGQPLSTTQAQALGLAAQPAPGYGTPPEYRGLGRTADWRDKDRDGVDDRDQDGPGMPKYGDKQPASTSPPANAAQPRPASPFEREFRSPRAQAKLRTMPGYRPTPRYYA